MSILICYLSSFIEIAGRNAHYPLLYALQTGIPLQGIIASHIPRVCFLSSSTLFLFLLTHELCRRGGGGSGGICLLFNGIVLRLISILHCRNGRLTPRNGLETTPRRPPVGWVVPPPPRTVETVTLETPIRGSANRPPDPPETAM